MVMSDMTHAIKAFSTAPSTECAIKGGCGCCSYAVSVQRSPCIPPPTQKRDRQLRPRGIGTGLENRGKRDQWFVKKAGRRLSSRDECAAVYGTHS